MNSPAILLNKLGHLVKTRIWSGPVKFLFLLLFGWLIYREANLIVPAEIDFSQVFIAYVTSHSVALVCVFLLLIFNVYCEAKKWQIAIDPVHNMGIKKALDSVLFGNTLGIFTPAKTGEYGGRMLYLDRGEHVDGALANLHCSLAQNSINLLAGSMCFGLNDRFNTLINNNLTLGIVTFSLLLTLIMLIVYFNLEKFGEYISGLSGMRKFFIKGNQDSLRSQHKWKVLQWSVLRYGVYGLQYILICHMFEFDLKMGILISGIGVIFLIQSLLILPPLMSIIARGETAVLIWSLFAVSIDKILMAAGTLWIINVLLPAVAGMATFALVKRKNPVN